MSKFIEIINRVKSIFRAHGPEFDAPRTSSELYHRLSTLEPSNEVDAGFCSARSPQQFAEIGMLRSAKSDFFLAKKFLAQADIASTCENWALETYNELCLQEKTHNSHALDGAEDEASPFEFLIVHSGNAGTTALQNFLCLHPNLIVAQKSEMDSAIEGGQEQALAEQYRRRIAAATVPVHAGMVQHGYVVGRLASPEIGGMQPGLQIVERLANTMCRDRFHHLVRNPLEVFRSVYNHRIVNQFAGGYSFPGSMNYPSAGRLSYGSMLSWPSNWDIPATGLPHCWDKSRSRNRNRGTAKPKLHVNAEEYRSLAQHAFDRSKYAAVGEAYSQYFSEWIPIDAAELLPGVSQQGMSRLFQEFGVNSDYRHPIFNTRGYDSVRRAMLSNGIELTGLDHPLFVYLDYTGQALYSHTFPFIELATIQPDHRWNDAGFADQPISLVVSSEQWVLQSSITRKRLIKNGVFRHILENVALPAWIECYNAWKSAIDGHFINDWQQMIERRNCTLAEVKHDVGKDIGRFLEVHPDFVRRWPGIEEIL